MLLPRKLMNMHWDTFQWTEGKSSVLCVLIIALCCVTAENLGTAALQKAPGIILAVHWVKTFCLEGRSEAPVYQWCTQSFLLTIHTKSQQGSLLQYCILIKSLALMRTLITEVSSRINFSPWFNEINLKSCCCYYLPSLLPLKEIPKL